MTIIATTSVLTINASASASNEIQLGDEQNLAFWMPDAWTAAPLAVQLARTTNTPINADWRTLTDGTGEISLPAAASRVIVLSALLLIPNSAYWLRVISGTVGAPVPQAATRLITVERRTMG